MHLTFKKNPVIVQLLLTGPLDLVGIQNCLRNSDQSSRRTLHTECKFKSSALVRTHIAFDLKKKKNVIIIIYIYTESCSFCNSQLSNLK